MLKLTEISERIYIFFKYATKAKYDIPNPFQNA